MKIVLFLGFAVLFLGIALAVVGFLLLFVATLNSSKRLKKLGLNILIAGGVTLLMSGTLCTSYAFLH